MAWWTINYSCGHTGYVQLYGKEADRERRAEWMERGVCPNCWRAEQENERRQENERAAALAKEIGFTPLVGSDKQIAWAGSIRQKAYESLCKLGDQHPVYGYGLIVEAINLETLAKWWIDNRDSDAVAMLNIIAANYPAKYSEIITKTKEGGNAA